MRTPASITRRIVVISTLASVLLLGGFGFYLDIVFGRYQEREYRNQIEAHLRFTDAEIRSIGDRPGDSEPEEIGEIAALFSQLNASEASERFEVLITNEDGDVLLAMDGVLDVMGADPPFPAPGDDLDAIEVRRWVTPSGHHLLLSTVRLGAYDGNRIVRSVLDWTRAEEERELFRNRALIALIVGAGISAILSAMTAKRALEPVHDLARAADRIDASSLDEPLETRPVPEELTGLVRSLSSMQRRLEESFSGLSAFATDLAHELRTPLNNLMGEITVALAYPREENEYRDILGSALEECQRLTRTIEGLLFVARADRGAVSLRSTRLDIGSEIGSLIEYYQLSADERGITIDLDGTAEVTADKDLIRQAIGNLLANAVQYVKDEGKVSVEVRRSGSFAEVSVSDDGPGIADNELDTIFERFSRGASARKSRTEGSGMGLAIVRSIARLHGGSAVVRSRPGEGTTVTLRIPIEAQREQGGLIHHPVAGE